MSERVKRALLVRRCCDKGVQLQFCAVSADSSRLFMGYPISAFRVVQEETPLITQGLYLQYQFCFAVFTSVDVTYVQARVSRAKIRGS